MLSVSVHKDIGEYSEKIIGKLSLRTLLCVAGGLGSAMLAAAFVYFVIGVDVSSATLPVMACSMPFWLAGFWRPCGMKLERFVPLWANHTFTDGKILLTPSTGLAAPALLERVSARPDRRDARKAKRKGAELYEPSKTEGR